MLALDPSYVKARNNLTYYPKRYRAPADWTKLIGYYCQAVLIWPKGWLQWGNASAAIAELQEVLRQVPEHPEGKNWRSCNTFIARQSFYRSCRREKDR